MDGQTEFLDLVSAKGRRVYVTEKPIDLRDPAATNTVYVLQLPDGSTAAGGRGGGFGERRIVRLYHFECREGTWAKVAEVEDEGKLDSLDLPYHATAMPILDTEGKERLVSGVVDPSFVESYRQVLA
ncbi:MAG: hypothetical protein OK441_02100 [Thaumarchaeota archaeon]|nr:hypothetical protein [Nitrososphaerota archaeon]